MKKNLIFMVMMFGFISVAGAGLFDAFFGKSGNDLKGTVKLTYVEWACATASTHTMQAVLQEKMGYEVKMLPVSLAAMYKALENGDADATMTVWLPVTSSNAMYQIRDKVEDLGANYHGAKLGLVVPEYVEIESLNDLKDHGDEFNHRIIGIDPGSEIMQTAENFIKSENLSEQYTLMEGSGAMMTMMLKEAVEKEEWIVVTGWKPHWKFGRWDLKILDDSDHYFGKSEEIHTVVRKGLKEDMPEVYRMLDNFYWEDKHISEQMGWNTEDGADPYENAVKWIEQNPEIVSKWIE